MHTSAEYLQAFQDKAELNGITRTEFENEFTAIKVDQLPYLPAAMSAEFIGSVGIIGFKSTHIETGIIKYKAGEYMLSIKCSYINVDKLLQYLLFHIYIFGNYLLYWCDLLFIFIARLLCRYFQVRDTKVIPAEQERVRTLTQSLETLRATQLHLNDEYSKVCELTVMFYPYFS